MSHDLESEWSSKLALSVDMEVLQENRFQNLSVRIWLWGMFYTFFFFLRKSTVKPKSMVLQHAEIYLLKDALALVSIFYSNFSLLR